MNEQWIQGERDTLNQALNKLGVVDDVDPYDDDAKALNALADAAYSVYNAASQLAHSLRQAQREEQ